MDTDVGRVLAACERQNGLIALWQLDRLGVAEEQVDVIRRQLRRVYRGVYALGDLDEWGWPHAAVLSCGPGAALSHASALVPLGLREEAPPDVHVSVPRGGGRSARDGIVPHRRMTIERWRAQGIPVTSPTQSLRDANLQPHELYRALEQAEMRGYPLALPLDDVVRLKRRVRGWTRSDAEARFVLLCHDRNLELPLVNQRLNGFETDFHWPQQRLVAELDGWEFHRERPQFEEDRRRTLIHTAAGFTVIRPSALHVEHQPDLVAAAVSQGLSGGTASSSTKRHRRPK